MHKEPITNKVEIFETLHFDECGTRTRKVLINDKLVICETTDAMSDRKSDSKVKHFIDWVLLVKRTQIIPPYNEKMKPGTLLPAWLTNLFYKTR